MPGENTTSEGLSIKDYAEKLKWITPPQADGVIHYGTPIWKPSLPTVPCKKDFNILI